MKNLKTLRQNNNLTQSAIAKKFNMPLITYQNYENGLRQPKIEIIIKIADFFGVSLDYLCNHETKAAAAGELDEIAKINNISDLDRSIIIKFMQMPQEQRDNLKSFINMLR